jgi:hypothetical protein
MRCSSLTSRKEALSDDFPPLLDAVLLPDRHGRLGIRAELLCSSGSCWGGPGRMLLPRTSQGSRMRGARNQRDPRAQSSPELTSALATYVRLEFACNRRRRAAYERLADAICQVCQRRKRRHRVQRGRLRQRRRSASRIHSRRSRVRQPVTVRQGATRAATRPDPIRHRVRKMHRRSADIVEAAMAPCAVDFPAGRRPGLCRFGRTSSGRRSIGRNGNVDYMSATSNPSNRMM